MEILSLRHRGPARPGRSGGDVKHLLRIAALDASIGRRARLQSRLREGLESRRKAVIPLRARKKHNRPKQASTEAPESVGGRPDL